MNNLLTYIVATAIFVLIVAGGLLGIYTYKPELLGIHVPVDSLALKMKDSLERTQRKRLSNDSISVAKKYLAGIEKQRDSLQKQIARLRDSSGYYKNQSASAVRERETLRAQMQAQEKVLEQRADSLEQANLAAFARMYEKAGPKEVARILAELDERDAGTILKMMKPKVSAKVLEQMDPVVASTIMRLAQPLKP
jgi:flagellar motility protein MotE (MotC chaperone)